MPFLTLVTLTFKLVRAWDQTHLPCEFGTNPFRSSGDISYANKKIQTDGVIDRTFCSSLCGNWHIGTVCAYIRSMPNKSAEESPKVYFNAAKQGQLNKTYPSSN